jgi:hypothetical protein
MLQQKWLTALITVAMLGIAEASGAETASDASAADGAAANGATARPAPTLQQRAVDMRRRAYESTVRDGQTVIARAAAGECHAVAARRVDRYRDVLESANALATRAEAALPANPGKAATLYVQAEKIARGVVSSGAAVECTATP